VKTVIYGAGATARMVAPLLGAQLSGVVADYVHGEPEGEATFLHNQQVHLAEDLRRLFPPSNHKLIICIGYQHSAMNGKRAELYELLSAAGYQFDRMGMPPPWFAESAAVGEGSVLLPGVVLHDSASVGVNCFVSSNTVIGHDVELGAHCWVNANVSIDGSAVIGERCVIGAGAVIGAGVRLGARTLVGPGAVVLRDTEPDSAWFAPAAEKQRFSSGTFGRMLA
jgi:sugar O-acyltransferase (sialic acid O-acetyltransferase NeuD family)